MLQQELRFISTLYPNSQMAKQYEMIYSSKFGEHFQSVRVSTFICYSAFIHINDIFTMNTFYMDVDITSQATWIESKQISVNTEFIASLLLIVLFLSCRRKRIWKKVYRFLPSHNVCIHVVCLLWQNTAMKNFSLQRLLIK